MGSAVALGVLLVHCVCLCFAVWHVFIYKQPRGLRDGRNGVHTRVLSADRNDREGAGSEVYDLH